MCSAVLILMLSCNSVFWFLFHRLFILFLCLAHLAGTLQQQNPKTQLNSDSKCRGKERLSTLSKMENFLMHVIFAVINNFHLCICSFFLPFSHSLSSYLLPKNRLHFWPAGQPDLQPRLSSALWPATEMVPTWTIVPAVCDLWPPLRPSHHPGSRYRRWRKLEVWAVAEQHTADVGCDNTENRWAQEVKGGGQEIWHGHDLVATIFFYDRNLVLHNVNSVWLMSVCVLYRTQAECVDAGDHM